VRVVCAGRRRAQIRGGSYKARIIGRAVTAARVLAMRDIQNCRVVTDPGAAGQSRPGTSAPRSPRGTRRNSRHSLKFRSIARARRAAWHSGCAYRRRLAVVQQLLAACRTQHARIAARGGKEMNLMTHVNAFVRDEEGQDLIEYALLVALISLVCVLALTEAGTQVNNIFTAIKDKLTAAAAPA
jgi:pilus assembly protein Flp/PilA